MTPDSSERMRAMPCPAQVLPFDAHFREAIDAQLPSCVSDLAWSNNEPHVHNASLWIGEKSPISRLMVLEINGFAVSDLV